MWTSERANAWCFASPVQQASNQRGKKRGVGDLLKDASIGCIPTAVRGKGGELMGVRSAAARLPTRFFYVAGGGRTESPSEFSKGFDRQHSLFCFCAWACLLRARPPMPEREKSGKEEGHCGGEELYVAWGVG